MASTKKSHKKRARELTPLFSIFLIITGSVVLAWAFWVHNGPSLVKVGQAEVVLPVAGSKPVRLFIPRLSRVLYVSEGTYVDSRWVVSDVGVSYLTTSALPGQTGNSVMYGHNRYGILGGLWRVESGDAIYVILDSGDFVRYRVYEEKEVRPTAVEILNATPDARLTIYTCSGFLDQARFVVVAGLDEVS